MEKGRETPEVPPKSMVAIILSSDACFKCRTLLAFRFAMRSDRIRADRSRHDKGFSIVNHKRFKRAARAFDNRFGPSTRLITFLGALPEQLSSYTNDND